MGKLVTLGAAGVWEKPFGKFLHLSAEDVVDCSQILEIGIAFSITGSLQVLEFCLVLALHHLAYWLCIGFANTFHSCRCDLEVEPSG